MNPFLERVMRQRQEEQMRASAAEIHSVSRQEPAVDLQRARGWCASCGAPMRTLPRKSTRKGRPRLCADPKCQAAKGRIVNRWEREQQRKEAQP